MSDTIDTSRYDDETRKMLEKLLPVVERVVSALLTKQAMSGQKPGSALPIAIPTFASAEDYEYFVDIADELYPSKLNFQEHEAVIAAVKRTLETQGWKVHVLVIEPQAFVRYLNALEGHDKHKKGEGE